MLRIIQNSSAAGAKNYYTSSDYYTEGQELSGSWRGLGAARLGLSGNVGREAWEALCDNRDPATGNGLTVRRKSERRVGYDFNFHAPKSLSLLYGLTRDERLLNVFRQSVDETMREMESEMQTRVRRGGRDEDRTTGNMVWGEFTHFTSRPVNGVPDPHLHSHNFVFNTTWDSVENRWKAGQFAGIKRDAPYFEAVFQSKLSERIQAIGLPVERTRHAWEIAGFSKATLDKFSRRTAQIEETARKKGIISQSAKAELGAKTREKKQQNLSMDELRNEWLSRLASDERNDHERLLKKIGTTPDKVNPNLVSEIVDKTISHCFERDSVVPERTFLREALRRSYGQASRTQVEEAALGHGIIRAEQNGRTLVSTQAMLDEESSMIGFAREGRGTCNPLGYETAALRRDWLSDEQRRAVRHILNSTDRVILVRGRAGVGKTTIMTEAVEQIETAGQQVFTFAPSAAASRGVLRGEGFDNAETVAKLLTDEKIQQQVRGHVLWIDEAGLLGVRTMRRVFNLADKLDARVILSGDDGQHGPVEAGSAFGLLETEAGLAPAEIVEIRRQSGSYKQAVAALSEGRVFDAFKQLDAMGAIYEVPREERYPAIAKEYIGARRDSDTCLVVSPTHAEARVATDAIRTALLQEGILGKDEHRFATLENANLTAAQRSDFVNLSTGDVLVYHQNATGHRIGDKVVVGQQELPLQQAERYTVYHPGVLTLATGDALRITKNGRSLDGRPLNNGDILTVEGFTESGDIEINGGNVISKDFGHLALGYVNTSHSAQGKTVNRVIIAESSDSFVAASREQFYVSISRGRKKVSIYTDDRDALLEAVEKPEDRLSATEFIAQQAERNRIAARVPTHEISTDRTREGVMYER